MAERREHDPRLDGKKKVVSFGWTEALIADLEREMVLERRNNKSAFSAELVAWALDQLREEREKAARAKK